MTDFPSVSLRTGNNEKIKITKVTACRPVILRSGNFRRLALMAFVFRVSFLTALFVLPCSPVLAPRSSALAQQPKKIPHIGVLVGSSASGVSTRIEAFRDSLRELGYVEGKTVIID